MPETSWQENEMKKGPIHNTDKAINYINLMWNLQDWDEENSKILKRTNTPIWLERDAFFPVRILPIVKIPVLSKFICAFLAILLFKKTQNILLDWEKNAQVHQNRQV